MHAGMHAWVHACMHACVTSHSFNHPLGQLQLSLLMWRISDKSRPPIIFALIEPERWDIGPHLTPEGLSWDLESNLEEEIAAKVGVYGLEFSTLLSPCMILKISPSFIFYVHPSVNINSQAKKYWRRKFQKAPGSCWSLYNLLKKTCFIDAFFFKLGQYQDIRPDTLQSNILWAL